MKIKKILKITIIAITIFFIQGNFIVHSQGLVEKIDSLLSEKFQPNNSGAVFLVSRDGATIYRKAFGKSNLELDANMIPENVFQIGSMTKQFTATSILMLHEQGKLDVNDKIAKFLPEYPKGEQITLHHLLTHTSGIKDYTKMQSIKEIVKQDLTPKEIVDFFKNEPIDFNPGEEFKYNNSGYALLGYIIELVSGETYEDFVESHIFEKIGMKNSRYANDTELIKNRAYGYHNRGEFTNKMQISLNIPYASGFLMSTVDDMLIWQNAINNSKLVSQGMIERAFTKYTLNNGQEFTYGYGWHIKDRNGIVVREHGGSIFGFKSMGVFIPHLNIYVIGLTNCDCNSPTQITRDIADLVINE